MLGQTRTKTQRHEEDDLVALYENFTLAFDFFAGVEVMTAKPSTIRRRNRLLRQGIRAHPQTRT